MKSQKTLEMETKLPHKPFYFMRHGTTESNMQQICQGQLDIPLNEIGIQEANNAVIENHEITHVFYSPLKRASETACIVTHLLTCPKIVLDDLKEWHFGDLQGKPWHLSHEEKAQQFKTLNPENGESSQQFYARIIKVINGALHQSAVPLFISHGGVFRVIADTLEIDHPQLGNCELIKLIPPADAFKSWSIIRLKAGILR